MVFRKCTGNVRFDPGIARFKGKSGSHLRVAILHHGLLFELLADREDIFLDFVRFRLCNLSPFRLDWQMLRCSKRTAYVLSVISNFLIFA